ncbi:uncharacterized protein E1O_19680 [Burkholderiales bacterium GJ-E10]|nr:uncharacterized protein E1O_19680 [Burkholderiales bacterium GJ-E10]
MNTSHARADRFSLLLHRDVARMLRTDPALVDCVRETVIRWQAMHANNIPAWDEWLAILDAGPQRIIEVLEDDGEDATRLRQSSPFAGVLTNRRRWELLEEVSREARGS